MRVRALSVIFATLCVSALMSSAASAVCLVTPITFNPPQNDSVSTSVVITNRSSCIIRFRSFSYLVFDSVSVSSRPGSGTVNQVSAMEFRYRPKAGFKGSDRFSLRVCGKGRTNAGCSTVTYLISVN